MRAPQLDPALTDTAHVDRFAIEHLPPRALWPELTVTLPELRYPARLNCAAELLDTTAAHLGGSRRCLVTDEEVWSYATLVRRSNQLATTLVDRHGLQPGNRVLLRGPNTPWQVACWLAVLKAGGIVVCTMPLLRTAELRAVIDIAQPTLALCDWRFTDDLARCQGVTVRRFGDVEAPDDLIAESRQQPETFASVDTLAADIALIAFTSGTTGRPKGCVHMHADVLAIADTFSRHVLRPSPDDLFVASPPMAFTYGLGGMVVFPLRCGAATLLLEQAAPKPLAEAIARHRATVLFTAPTAYRAMLKIEGADLSSLRRCVSAGEHLPASTWQAWFDATGVRIIDGIGATEMLHIFISASGADIRPGSTGRAVPGFEARLVDADGEPVPDGQIGRLQVRGPVGCRYLDDERQQVYVQDGWNTTGDTFVRDGDGYYWYQARTDDMIVSSGYNIAGPEVEGALMTHPDVAEAAVVGVADADRGMIVKALVVLRPGLRGDAIMARALQDHVKSEIAPYKYPRAVEFCSELPRTATGKLQRFRLRDR